MRALALALGIGAACAPPVADGSDTDLPTGGAGSLVLATASDDYAVGALTVVDLAAREAVDVTTLHGDAVVRVEGDAVWAVERLLVDAVRRYAPGAWTAPAWQASTGRGSNPHDVALCGGELLVSRYESAALLRLDPADGSVLGEVDLAAHADGDGLPEASGIVVVGGAALVALQRLDRDAGWTKDGPGRVVRVDCATWGVDAWWEVGPNPELVAAPGGAVALSEDGLHALDGESVGEVVVPDLGGARVVDLAHGVDGRGAFVARVDDAHLVGCVDEDGAFTVADTSPRFLVDVEVVDGDGAWIAARRGWSEPERPGALLHLDLDGCVVDAEITTTLAPFSVALVPPAEGSLVAREGAR